MAENSKVSTEVSTRHHLPTLKGRASTLGVAAAVALVALSISETVAAVCLSPSPTLEWSYPEQGADDVPLDADLLVMGGSLGMCQSVTLNGEPLEAQLGLHLYDLGQLAPNTDYEVVFSCTDFGSQENTSMVLNFKTGDQLAEPATEPVIVNAVDVSSEPDYPSTESLCSRLESQQGCFDTGPPSRFEFQTTGAAKLWVIEIFQDGTHGNTSSLVPMPAVCGAPVWRSYSQEVGRFRIHAISENGSITTSDWRDERDDDKIPVTIEPPPGVVRSEPAEPTSAYDGTLIPEEVQRAPIAGETDSASGCGVHRSSRLPMHWPLALLAIASILSRRLYLRSNNAAQASL